MEKLSSNFIPELFKLMFMDKDIMGMCRTHLKYTFIPKEMPGYKILLRDAVAVFDDRNIVPSLGVIAQKYNTTDYVQEAVDEIREAEKADKEMVIEQLELFLRKIEFKELVNKVHDLYEEGKPEEAIQTTMEESKRIQGISLRNQMGNFKSALKGFEERMLRHQEERLNGNKDEKVTFGIDALDHITYGGVDKGDTALWILRSGVGKSTVLKWHGYRACMDGKKVLHIQLEGGVDACESKYDQIFTMSPYSTVKKGDFSPETLERMRNLIKDVQDMLGSDIDIYGFEKYGEASMLEVRNIVLEYQKIRGYFPDLLILDSLDLAVTGENKQVDTDPKNLKYRLQKNAQRFKDMCNEFRMAGITCAQASDVPIEIWNNPDKVIDRSFTEGDKTLVKPFSYVFTGNVTRSEKEMNRLRIYVDKLRDYRNSGTTYLIATNYDKGAFYNAKDTVQISGYLDPLVIQKAEKKEKMVKAGTAKTDI